MAYHGDIASQQTLYFTFTTNAAGVPTTLAGTPVLSVYKDDGTTQTTTGPTLVADFDGVTGLNSVKIITTNAFYAIGHDYSVVITTGTVGGVSAVGYVVGSFSIENRTGKQILGAGSTSKTITVEAPGGTPKDGAVVWITTDIAGTNVVASGTTDAFGHVTFMLDPGTYYGWKQLAGFTFTNPESFTVP